MEKFTKTLTFYVLLLEALLLGIGSAHGESLSVKSSTKIENLPQSSLPSSRIWVMNKNKQLERKNFTWVVEDPQKSRQQPFLQIANNKGKSPKKGESKSQPPKAKGDLKDFDEVVKDTEKSEGVFTIYRNKENNKIYLEIKPEQLNKNFLAAATLESGIGEQGIYSGLPLQDFLFYFQKLDNKLQFVVRNVNFRTNEGDPQKISVARSFSDSVLYNLNIQSIHPERQTILIDLGDLLLTDLAGLSASIELSTSPDQSYFGKAKVFPHNLEVQSIFNFTSAGKGQSLDVLADSRGFTLRVHYSLSELPNNNYQPRLADDRVGYFITAYQDLSRKDINDPFVRYINRWNLEKQDPNAAVSKPKKPIVFWIDNAVPFEYRDAIKEGVLMWNQAFLKAGFQDAIEVKQMPSDAAWDAADIRYNTIRWINTVDGYFALGPSRVNPLNGEILDADILIDASFVRALRKEYKQIVLPNVTTNSTNIPTLSALMKTHPLCSQEQEKTKGLIGNLSKLAGEYDLCYGMESANQFAFGALAMSMLSNTAPTEAQMKDYVHQYLRLIVAHEVGHTLGLRHNFRGSNLLPPEEMNNPLVTQTKGLTASVMDYIPPNIAPNGTTQGDFFPDQVGSYDMWAIEYGYTSFGVKSTAAEKPFLAEIAKKSEQPELSYSPDEDTSEIDPTSAPWDNSGNVLVYSQWQLDNSLLMWDKLNRVSPTAGEDYSDVRDRFNTIFGNYLRQLYYTSKYIGGQSFYRVDPSDNRERLPFVPVPVEQQRQALDTLQKYVFAEKAFNFSPDLLNKLAPSRWLHWGSSPKQGRLDYPVHDLVLFTQSIVLSDLLSGDRLSRMKDLELKSKAGEALTIPELFTTLQTGIWSEVLQPKGRLQISSLRRGLQRQYVNFLTAMVLRQADVPEDARTLAWYKLKQLDVALKRVKSDDEYTKAHLLETRNRIEKTLDAPLQGN
ncbi:MAG: DUF5117 domain-containing protein [Nostocales cyanobacterium]|nr:MAG: DUF5117 domain-containing protein [Nostocales cyanobacterium]TAF14940.1 MAG: DUF5117 domain-containing protein [Nostocales cyanobacterium]